MDKIIVITTGGTIAMSEDLKTKSVKPIDQDTIDRMLPYLDKHADVEMDHFINIPSPHMTPEIMYDLALHTKKHLENNEVKGIVITHGTDTLEETAYFLDLLISNDKPIVVTGAMRSSNELGADGPLNLVNAVRVAADDSSRGKGVLVVFNDEIHAARYVTKTHTSNIATFQSPENGPIGTVTKRGIRFSHAPLIRDNYPLTPPVNKVGLIKAAAGMDDLLINTYLENGYKGIVIEALGQGNLPPAMVNGIKKGIELGVAIVLVSRCFNGFVDGIYDYEGGGKQLKELGVIFSNGLNGQKARIKLMLTLNLVKDSEKIQQLFDI
ncbi:L-asparaginase [Vulcanibacillus modesticaldus]|uniref:asparaginase n=1 Tax=Vulcanibacillus modesticaldus TaxID=337097 RepID=A0A1D2YSH6_9BACI|nr:asparaginase [Vulcanibacillus modesticaldus]OEF97274.1 L-asparaginase [Vulcanibacillus modesticaldus]